MNIPGFLPTFGPCWINMYGSTRHYSLLEEHAHLNEGLGEGVSYRGRLLIALKTEILDAEFVGPSTVDIENCAPISQVRNIPQKTILEVPVHVYFKCNLFLQSSIGRYDEFFLFGSIFEATMIDKKLSEKPISFELSIGISSAHKN